jgi:molybdate transport system regulatory protein
MPGRIKIKVQLFRGQEIALGPGKADLLDAIAREGSIAAAARNLGMSYRRAWLLVDAMNRSWNSPLVNAVPGARRGAALSELGFNVLADYRKLERALTKVGNGAAATGLLSRISTQD